MFGLIKVQKAQKKLMGPTRKEELTVRGDLEAIDPPDRVEAQYISPNFKFHKIYKIKVIQVQKDLTSPARRKDMSRINFIIAHQEV